MSAVPDAELAPLAGVQDSLTRYLASRVGEADALHTSFGEAARMLREFVLSGGKRLRPIFAWWGWRGAGGTATGPDAERILRAVSALELIQASALVHDDLIDDSATRRGHPTVHVRFGERHRRAGWAGSAERYGAALAVLLGDLALCWADDMLAAAGLGAAATARVRPVWAAMRTEVLAGQLLDVRGQACQEDGIEAPLLVNRLKTAKYTVERPLEMGAALAGAAPALTAAYRGFGADVGVAFQLRDDLLGVFGDPEVTGKPAGDDLREGKRTVLVALGLQAARQHGRGGHAAVLESSLGDPELAPAGVDRVRDILRELGAEAEVERRIEQLTASGLAALHAADVASPADTALTELAYAATRRRH